MTAYSVSPSRLTVAEILISSSKVHHMEIFLDGAQHVGATLQMQFATQESQNMGHDSSSQCDNKEVAGRTSFLPEIRQGGGIPEILPPLVWRPGKTPYDEVQWENAGMPHDRQRQRLGHLRAARDIEVPQRTGRQTATNIVREPEILPRQTRARPSGSAVWRNWCIARSTASRTGVWRAATSRRLSMAKEFPQRTGPSDAAPESRVQFSGVVQRVRAREGNRAGYWLGSTMRRKTSSTEDDE